MISLIATERFVEPANPTLVVLITLVHHRSVLLSFLSNDEELTKNTTSSESFDIVHTRLHKTFELDCRWIVVVVAKDRLVGVSFASRRMCKPG